MYYPDLTPYTYLKEHHGQPALNVGWLDSRYPYQEATPGPTLVKGLRFLSRYPTNQTRGYHDCPFCYDESGSAEIRVKGEDGKIYAAPMLILHYVAEHHYQPPAEFTAAVIKIARNPLAKIEIAASWWLKIFVWIVRETIKTLTNS